MEGADKSWNYFKLSLQTPDDNNMAVSSRTAQRVKGKSSNSTTEVNLRGGSRNKFSVMTDSKAPVDTHSKIYVAFILSGIGYMLPFTCFIAAVDYYQDRFPHTTIIFDMTATTIIIGSLGVFLNNALIETLSLTYRVMFGYVISTSLLLFLTTCDVTMKIFHDDAGYWMTLVAVAIIAIGCAVQQSSFYGYANMLPHRYTQAVMVGESFAGVLVSLNRIITKLLLDDERVNTIIFFLISIAVIALCCSTFFLARRTHFVQYHLSSCKEDKRQHESNTGSEFTMTNGSPNSQFGLYEFEVPSATSCSDANTISSLDTIKGEAPTRRKPSDGGVINKCMATTVETEENIQVSFKGSNQVMYGLQGDKNDAERLGSTNTLVIENHSTFKARCLARWEVTKQIYPFMTSFALTFYVTVSLYPGIISEVVSCNLGSWMPVLLMACFNVTDAFGKMLISIKPIKHYAKLRLFLYSLFRFIFIPFAVLCIKPRLHPTLNGEAWSILITLLLGVSNGYFGSLPLVLAPSQVAPRHRELCGNTMMLSFTVAIICGAFTSYGLDLVVGPYPDLDVHCSSVGRRNITDVASFAEKFQNFSLHRSQ